MPHRPWRLRIEDILEHIGLIQEFTRRIAAGGGALLRDHRRSVAHVPPVIQTRYPGVPWLDMREMRNVISHVYHNVSVRIMWETIQDDLPPLVPKLREILEKEP